MGGSFLAKVVSARSAAARFQHSGIRDEIRQYKTNANIMAKDRRLVFEGLYVVDPLKYWHNHREQFPGLSKLANITLPVSATSVASEQMFSAAGPMSTGHRNRIGK